MSRGTDQHTNIIFLQPRNKVPTLFGKTPQPLKSCWLNEKYGLNCWEMWLNIGVEDSQPAEGRNVDGVPGVASHTLQSLLGSLGAPPLNQKRSILSAKGRRLASIQLKTNSFVPLNQRTVTYVPILLVFVGSQRSAGGLSLYSEVGRENVWMQVYWFIMSGKTLCPNTMIWYAADLFSDSCTVISVYVLLHLHQSESWTMRRRACALLHMHAWHSAVPHVSSLCQLKL